MGDQVGVPFLFMRGGTSRGPYFKRADLPDDLDKLTRVLVAMVGAGHPLNIDGVGGGEAVTTKVAMLSRSSDDWADIDYFFAQVAVEEALADYKPTCGNILAGVGPAAIEMGLVPTDGDETKVRILSTNTGVRVEALVRTPGGKVAYGGDTRIDGVPGTAAPVQLNFMDIMGAATGTFLPTGTVQDTFQGIDVTCMDVAMPMVIARATDFGLSGHETREELDGNRELLEKMEALRLEAGTRMGLGDVSKSVTPKFGLLSAPRSAGAMSARYFTPWACHPTMAVTGAQCLASCILTPGTIAQDLISRPREQPATVVIEHPGGSIEVIVDYEIGADGIEIHSAGLLRTARKIAVGEIFVPTVVWDS